MSASDPCNDCQVLMLDGGFAGEVRSLLYHAYRRDPAWVYVLEAERPDYEQRVRATLREIVARHLADELPTLGLFRDDSLVGVALLQPPVRRLEFTESWPWRLRMLARVGLRGTRRFIAYQQAILASLPEGPHHHITLLAVHPLEQGRHLGEQLFQAVHRWCAEEGGSRGVVLDSANLALEDFYVRQGYREVAEIALGPLRERLFVHAHAPMALQSGLAG